MNECIIIGGGKSIQDGANQGLGAYLSNKFTILTNYAFKHFKGTFMAFSDRDFYKPRPDSDNPDIYDELKSLPLIIGLNLNGIEEFKLNNTILLDKKYRTTLTGILALKLGIAIMKKGTIYLLGFDWNRRTNLPERDPNYNPKSNIPIHYYNDIQHRGIGYHGYYENHNPNKEFVGFTKNKDIKIYNVSPESNIECFDKISYPEMFKLLGPDVINQEKLRLSIKNQLTIGDDLWNI